MLSFGFASTFGLLCVCVCVIRLFFSVNFDQSEDSVGACFEVHNYKHHIGPYINIYFIRYRFCSLFSVDLLACLFHVTLLLARRNETNNL